MSTEQVAAADESTLDPYLADVHDAGQRREEARRAFEAATDEWQHAIRRAVLIGARRTTVAQTAGISRERLYQILAGR